MRGIASTFDIVGAYTCATKLINWTHVSRIGQLVFCEWNRERSTNSPVRRTALLYPRNNHDPTNPVVLIGGRCELEVSGSTTTSWRLVAPREVKGPLRLWSRTLEISGRGAPRSAKWVKFISRAVGNHDVWEIEPVSPIETAFVPAKYRISR